MSLSRLTKHISLFNQQSLPLSRCVKHKITFTLIPDIDSDPVPANAGTLTSLYEYDAFGNVLTETNALGISIQQQVDTLGRLQKVRDVNGNVYGYLYDKNGKLIEETIPTGAKSHISYNTDGLPVQHIDMEGNITSHQYNDAGYLIGKTVTAAGETVPQQLVTYNYNAVGDWVEIQQSGNSSSHFVYTRDALGRTVEELITYGKGDAAFTVRLNYRYDADGGLAGLTYPDGSEISFSREKGLLKQSRLPRYVSR